MPALLQDAFAGGTNWPFFSFPGGIGAPGLGPIVTGGRRRTRRRRGRGGARCSRRMHGGRRTRRHSRKLFGSIKTGALLKKLSKFFGRRR